MALDVYTQHGILLVLFAYSLIKIFVTFYNIMYWSAKQAMEIRNDDHLQDQITVEVGYTK